MNDRRNPPGVRPNVTSSNLPCVTLILLAGCSASHPSTLPVPCQPDRGNADCPAGYVCRATLTEDEEDGETFCMLACGDLVNGLARCHDGAACVARRPGPEWVCWVGGPREQGEPCQYPTHCGFGMRCDRDYLCEPICEDDADCLEPGRRCEWGVCNYPVPQGSPCGWTGDCSPQFPICGPTGLYTCQAYCREGHCPDGSPCTELTECFRDVILVDECAREGSTSLGCPAASHQVCARSAIGAYRCTRPCNFMEETSSLCNCLPDPDDPSQDVCILGGPAFTGESCVADDECHSVRCRDGVCVARCGEGLRSCDETMVHAEGRFVCVDGECRRESTE